MVGTIGRPAVTAAAGILILLAGCAPPSDRMEILVDTKPPGASCQLERQGQTIAAAAPTPAIALVDPSDAEITVRCHRNGFADVMVNLRPRPEAPAVIPRLAPTGPYEQRVDIALVPR